MLTGCLNWFRAGDISKDARMDMMLSLRNSSTCNCTRIDTAIDTVVVPLNISNENWGVLERKRFVLDLRAVVGLGYIRVEVPRAFHDSLQRSA